MRAATGDGRLPARTSFETEVKLRTPPGFALPDLDGVTPGVVTSMPQDLELETIYYDSADLALASAGISLRRRTGTPGAPWTLKLPATSVHGTPVERQLSFAEPPDEVPEAARDLLHIHLRSRLLLPVARLHSSRTTLNLTTRGGVRQAEVVYDRVAAYRDSEPMNDFGEIEVHADGLDRASCELADAVVRRLCSVGCEVTRPAPKLLRAFGVLSPAGVPAHEALQADDGLSLADVLADALTGSVERLMAHDVGVRLDEDIEDVHQLRVAARRLRSDLRTLRPVLDRRWNDQVRSELSWLGSLAGPVRDADVLLVRLTAAVATLPAADVSTGARVLVRLGEQRAGHRDVLLAGMRSARYDLLLDVLADAVAHLPFSGADHEDATAPASPLLARMVRRQWRELYRLIRKLGKEPSIAQLHQIRIQMKRCRYAAEAAVPALGKPARQLARVAAAAQTVLGDLHDAVVAEAWLRDAGAADPELACVSGQLIAGQRADAERLRLAWGTVWPSLGAKAERRLSELGQGR